nr:uncharacterized protein LOC129386640 [Dermacentor andersoni]
MQCGWRELSPRCASSVSISPFYVGGNDLESNMDPQEICDNIKALIVQRDVPPVVLVFKVLPRCLEDADAEQKMQKRRLLNHELTATLKRMPCLRNLNLELYRVPWKILPCTCNVHCPCCSMWRVSCGTVEEAKKGPLYNRFFVTWNEKPQPSSCCSGDITVKGLPEKLFSGQGIMLCAQAGGTHHHNIVPVSHTLSSLILSSDVLHISRMKV